MKEVKGDLVTLVECKTYDLVEVRQAITRSLEPFGGIESFISPGQRVALKPNILRAADPGRAVTTHPAVAAVVAELVIKAGGTPFIIDSPGTCIPYVPNSLKRIYKKCGYMNLSPPVELNMDCRFEEVSYIEGKVLKRFEILSPVMEADAIINLPKVKTHGLTYLTCGVKNLFGVIPGLHKPAYHGKFQNREDFSIMLIDLYKLLKPCLTICDGIIGMEGDGPSWGGTRRLGLVTASPDSFLLDMIISYLIGFDPMKIPYLMQASKDNLCPENIHAIKTVNDKKIETLRVPFSPPNSFINKNLSKDFKLKQNILFNILCRTCKKILSVKPAIKKDSCQGCGICIKGCPKKAIKLLGTKAIIDYNKCIHCYCCHELCPYNCVYIKIPIFNRILRIVRRFI